MPRRGLLRHGHLSAFRGEFNAEEILSLSPVSIPFRVNPGRVSRQPLDPAPAIATERAVLGLGVEFENVAGPVHRRESADPVESPGASPPADAMGGNTEETLSASGVYQSRCGHKRASLSEGVMGRCAIPRVS